MKQDSVLYAYSSRIAVGLAASGGLICAACISGLPAATCKTLALLYVDELQFFGIAGFCGIVILSVLAIPNRDGDREHKTDRLFVWALLGTGFLTVLLGFIGSTQLYGVINGCLH